MYKKSLDAVTNQYNKKKQTNTERKKETKKPLKPDTRQNHHSVVPKTHINPSFFLDKESGAAKFYEFYSKEPHRKFQHLEKRYYLSVIQYLLNNIRSIWDGEGDFWKLRTDISVSFYAL